MDLVNCVFFEALKPTDRLCDFVTDGQELTALVVASVAGDFFCQVRGGLGSGAVVVGFKAGFKGISSKVHLIGTKQFLVRGGFGWVVGFINYNDVTHRLVTFNGGEK